MSVKTKKIAAHRTRKENTLTKIVQRDFKPELNGSYRIKFDKKYSDAGFTVLLKGGMFHRFPDGFVITKKHRELLEEEKVPFILVKEE